MATRKLGYCTQKYEEREKASINFTKPLKMFLWLLINQQVAVNIEYIEAGDTHTVAYIVNSIFHKI